MEIALGPNQSTNAFDIGCGPFTQSLHMCGCQGCYFLVNMKGFVWEIQRSAKVVLFLGHNKTFFGIEKTFWETQRFFSGVSHDDPENSKRSHLRVPALQTPPKFHRKRRPERTQRVKFLSERRKKKRQNLGPHPSGRHLSGPHPSSTLPPTLRGSHQLALNFYCVCPPVAPSSCFCGCFCGCRPLKNPPLPLVSFQYEKKNLEIDETPLTSEKVYNKLFVSRKKPLVSQKKTLVSQ